MSNITKNGQNTELIFKFNKKTEIRTPDKLFTQNNWINFQNFENLKNLPFNKKETIDNIKHSAVNGNYEL